MSSSGGEGAAQSISLLAVAGTAIAGALFAAFQKLQVLQLQALRLKAPDLTIAGTIRHMQGHACKALQSLAPATRSAEKHGGSACMHAQACGFGMMLHAGAGGRLGGG
mmetsp:Transcript_2836/g.7416  ORF Transcript_2836/g.7416 Transcript_2836/m.7416 type:complete len:108 (-) Transcript_2836:2940-3263(-)|eukprot:1160282-Pelagomonas_calceolata.AAC.1